VDRTKKPTQKRIV
jgi:adenylate kinase